MYCQASEIPGCTGRATMTLGSATCPRFYVCDYCGEAWTTDPADPRAMVRHTLRQASARVARAIRRAASLHWRNASGKAIIRPYRVR